MDTRALPHGRADERPLSASTRRHAVTARQHATVAIARRTAVPPVPPMMVVVCGASMGDQTGGSHGGVEGGACRRLVVGIEECGEGGKHAISHRLGQLAVESLQPMSHVAIAVAQRRAAAES